MGARIPPLEKLPDSQEKSAVIDDRKVASGTGFEPWWDRLARTMEQDAADRFNVPADILLQSQNTNYASAKANYDLWKRRQDHAYRKLQER